MTRSRIQGINFFISLLIFLLAHSAVCDGVSREAQSTGPVGKTADGSVKKAGVENPPAAVAPVQKTEHEQQTGEQSPGPTATILDGNKTAEDLTSKSSVETNRTTQHKERLGDSLNPGALLRGIYVFVGLSVLVMAYIVFRSFRLSKTRAQMVRKYGVLAHRQDVEMRPLPLEEEDDEDTTVFDASNVMTNNVQHQNL